MIALNDGVDVTTGKRVAKASANLPKCRLSKRFSPRGIIRRAQLIRQGIVLDNCADMVIEQEVPDVLCSALVDDCIGRGKHLKEGGAVYDIVSQLQVGVANLGDSLAAIKKCVFEDRSLTREELWDALMHDFAGERGEEIRQILLNVPKYGNDDDFVDELVVRGYDTYLDEIKKYKNTRYGQGADRRAFLCGDFIGRRERAAGRGYVRNARRKARGRAAGGGLFSHPFHGYARSHERVQVGFQIENAEDRGRRAAQSESQSADARRTQGLQKTEFSIAYLFRHAARISCAI